MTSLPYKMETPRVTLTNINLWHQFYKHGTEMIINKHGRLMFPTLEFNVSGIEEDKLYVCLVDFVPVGSKPVKYVANQWLLNQPSQTLLGSGQQEHVRSIKLQGLNTDFPVKDGIVIGIPIKDCGYNRFYVHPDSPRRGRHWMQSASVVFSRLKLTNSKNNPPHQVALTSMHIYQPRLHIVQVREDRTCIEGTVVTSTFPETRFIAVTSYQNPEITQLKVKFNKFAHGDRARSVKRQQKSKPQKRRRSPDSSNVQTKSCGTDPATFGQLEDTAASDSATLMSLLEDFQPVSQEDDAAATSSTFADDFLAMLEASQK